jgi:hypothetical protein
MNDAAYLHQRPEHQPLQDCRRSIACACSALQAAVTRAPHLLPDASRLHAELQDCLTALAMLEQQQ